ncbi:MAG: nuclear transport factor 2 family protein, partial [bacterium]|nr:nuclear transport factor 2 family protein [bacterium]
MDKAVHELLDFHAIQQLMVRYADRIDANDPEGAASCFAEDGVGKYWGDCEG